MCEDAREDGGGGSDAGGVFGAEANGATGNDATEGGAIGAGAEGERDEVWTEEGELAFFDGLAVASLFLGLCLGILGDFAKSDEVAEIFCWEFFRNLGI